MSQRGVDLPHGECIELGLMVRAQGDRFRLVGAPDLGQQVGHHVEARELQHPVPGRLPALDAAPEALEGDDVYATVRERVEATPLVDTHEHLIEEEGRLTGASERIEANVGYALAVEKLIGVETPPRWL